MGHTRDETIAAMLALLDTLPSTDRTDALRDLFARYNARGAADTRAQIVAALQLGRDMEGAAAVLGIGRRSLQRRMRDLGMPAPSRGRPRRVPAP